MTPKVLAAENWFKRQESPVRHQAAAERHSRTQKDAVRLAAAAGRGHYIGPAKVQATMSGDVQTTQGVKTQAERKVERPRLYNVLLHNDDYTTMEFVIMILMTVFHRPEAEAVRIMLHVHTRGVGVAGVYPREVAEARVAKVTRIAREHEYPLRCSMEPA